MEIGDSFARVNKLKSLSLTFGSAPPDASVSGWG
jgi:hypothetical protein